MPDPDDYTQGIAVMPKRFPTTVAPGSIQKAEISSGSGSALRSC